MAKRGRPSSGIKTELVHLRLPVAILKRMRGSPLGLTGEIKNRLAQSVEEAERNADTRAFVAAVAWIADEIRRDIGVGVSWRNNSKAREALIAAVQAWLEANANKRAGPAVASDLFGPDDPATLGRTIARHYIRWTTEAEKGLREIKSTQEKRNG
jgi:hypothetical protein